MLAKSEFVFDHCHSAKPQNSRSCCSNRCVVSFGRELIEDIDVMEFAVANEDE
jgi:hypothetical protein